MKNDNELFGHPKGLYILFFTELWERFSFYGMRAILVLYMIAQLDTANPGFGWSKAFALSIYGWYGMAVYLASVPGGFLADRFLGQKKAVLLGGLSLCFGHGILAVDSQVAFFIGIALIVIGVGLLKPNISTMVGGLYAKGDVRRESGFTLFYIGINIGAFMASLLVGYVGETINWHYGFGLAGIGMLIGQLVYVWGQRYLTEVGNFVPLARSEKTKAPIKLTKIERDRVVVLMISFLISIVFWGAFEQGGGLMNIYTLEKIDRHVLGTEIPASVFQSLNPLFIMMFGVVVAAFWMKRHLRGKESSSLYQMAIGTIIMGLGFVLMAGASLETVSSASGKAGLYWLVGSYLLHTIGELCLSPVVLSFITKLAPLKYASMMMGLYFAATGVAQKLAGIVGEYAEQAGELQLFTGIFVFSLAVGLLVLVFLKKLKALSHGAEA
jgi:POT family proton-dependent oligopeptide transporter